MTEEHLNPRRDVIRATFVHRAKDPGGFGKREQRHPGALRRDAHRGSLRVSWNFRHIVNLNRIHGFNAVNLRAGYPMLEMRSPLELWKDDNEDI